MSSVNFYNVTEPTQAWVVYDRLARTVQSAWTLKREADAELRNNNDDAVVQTTMPIYTKTRRSELYVQSDDTTTVTGPNLATQTHVEAERKRIPLELHLIHRGHHTVNPQNPPPPMIDHLANMEILNLSLIHI